MRMGTVEVVMRWEFFVEVRSLRSSKEQAEAEYLLQGRGQW